MAFGGNNQSGSIEVATARNACGSGSGRLDFETETFLVQPVTHTLRGEDFDASEDGTGRGTPLVPVAIRFNAQMSVSQVDFDLNQTLQAKNPSAVLAFDTTQVTSKANVSNPKPGDPCHPLAAGAHAPAVAYGFQPRIARNGRGDMGDVVSALAAQSGGTGKGDAAPCVATAMQVRRLTPRECERLQGFPDDYTAIPWRKKTADQCPDGPRYKALGNSMAVPVMRWIGERIAMVDEIERSQKQA